MDTNSKAEKVIDDLWERIRLSTALFWERILELEPDYVEGDWNITQDEENTAGVDGPPTRKRFAEISEDDVINKRQAMKSSSAKKSFTKLNGCIVLRYNSTQHK